MNQQVSTPRELTEHEKFCRVLDSERFQEDLISQLRGTAVTPDKFTASMKSALRQNPDLLDCDRPSLYNAILKGAAEGLLPDGNDGIVNVYNTKAGGQFVKKAQWQRMVGGIIKMLARANIDAYVVSVYKNEEEQGRIEVWNDGDGQHVKHRPILFGDRGERIGALAVAKMPNGMIRFEAMNVEDLKKAQLASKSKNKETGEPTGPWLTWPERMEQKSCLHRLARRVPILDPQAEAALRKLNDEFYEDDDTPAPSPVSVAANRPQALQTALAHESQPGQPLPGANIVQTPETAGAAVDVDAGDDDGKGII